MLYRNLETDLNAKEEPTVCTLNGDLEEREAKVKEAFNLFWTKRISIVKNALKMKVQDALFRIRKMIGLKIETKKLVKSMFLWWKLAL